MKETPGWRDIGLFKQSREYRTLQFSASSMIAQCIPSTTFLIFLTPTFLTTLKDQEAGITSILINIINEYNRSFSLYAMIIQTESAVDQKLNCLRASFGCDPSTCCSLVLKLRVSTVFVLQNWLPSRNSADLICDCPPNSALNILDLEEGL